MADWITNYKATATKRLELEYLTIAERMREIAGWVRHGDAALIGAHADDVLDALRGLRMALVRKAGAGAGE